MDDAEHAVQVAVALQERLSRVALALRLAAERAAELGTPHSGGPPFGDRAERATYWRAVARRAARVADDGMLAPLPRQRRHGLDPTDPTGDGAPQAVAEELGDGVVRDLFHTGLRLQAVMSLTDGPVRERVAEAVEEIDAVIRDIRTLVFDLVPTGPEAVDDLPVSGR